MSVSERKFGVLQTGETVKIFHLENKSGAYAVSDRILEQSWLRSAYLIKMVL